MRICVQADQNVATTSRRTSRPAAARHARAVRSGRPGNQVPTTALPRDVRNVVSGVHTSERISHTRTRLPGI